MRQFMTQQRLSLRRMRVVLARGKMNIGTPGESDRSDGGRFGTHVNANVREAGAQSRFHFGLNVAGQRPPAGLRLHADLKCVDAGTALYGRAVVAGAPRLNRLRAGASRKKTLKHGSAKKRWWRHHWFSTSKH
jgi:hypothetical protein